MEKRGDEIKVRKVYNGKKEIGEGCTSERNNSR
jgi:hypothetical protein